MVMMDGWMHMHAYDDSHLEIARVDSLVSSPARRVDTVSL